MKSKRQQLYKAARFLYWAGWSTSQADEIRDLFRYEQAEIDYIIEVMTKMSNKSFKEE